MLFKRKKNIDLDAPFTKDIFFKSELGDIICLHKEQAVEYYANCDGDEAPFHPLMTYGFSTSPLLQGVNHIENGSFRSENVPWVCHDKQVTHIGRNLAPEWTLSGMGTGVVSIPKLKKPFEFTYHHSELGSYLPVKPGETYCFQGYFGMHRMFGDIQVVIYNKNKRKVYKDKCYIRSEMAGGQSLSQYGFSQVKIKIPEKLDAAYAVLSIETRVDMDSEVAMDSFLFMTGLYFGLYSENVASFGDADPELVNLLLGGVLQKAHASCARLEDLNITGDVKKTVTITEGSNREPVKLKHKIVYLPFDQKAVGGIDAIRERIVSGHVVGELDRTCLLDIRLNGEKIAQTSIAYAGKGRVKHSFVYELPRDVCTGDVSYIEVCAPNGKSLARMYHIFPSNLMPWEGLQEHTMPPFPNHLAPMAARRYSALQDQMNLENDPARLKQIIYCHNRVAEGFDQNRRFEPLTFPKEKNPTVSIVIPVHNKFEVTYFCLCAILLSYNETSYEIIITDDASSDRTTDIQKYAENITYVRNEKALGFVGNCNRGAEEARGAYIYFLNNDTEITNRCLDELIYAFEEYDHVGLTGSKLIYPDGRLQEAGGVIWENGDPWNYGRLANNLDPKYCYTRQTDYMSGAALMVRHDLWKEIGGFSQEYAPAYFEDVDLAYKVRAQGYKTLFVPHSIVVHHEGISNGTEVATSTGLKRFQEINRPKFQEKWKDDFEKSGPPLPHIADIIKDRGIGGRVLCIDVQMPRPDMDAGSYAAIQEMKALQALGYKITFMPDNAAYLGKYADMLERMGVETLYAPFCNWVGQVLQERGAEFDIVYITRYHMVQKYIDLVRHHAPQAKVLFCNADLHFLRELRKSIREGDEEAIDDLEELRDEELAASEKVDLTLSYNSVEHAIITSMTMGKAKVAKCPWVVETRDDVPPFSAREGIAFLGGYAHPPNLEAMEYFIEDVMPHIREAGLDVTFYVYGSRVPDSLKALECDDIKIVGFIEDVKDLYDKHRVFVVPLLTGAGIKGKVLGAMSHGIPCVLSPVAAEGTGARSGYDCAIASTHEDWVTAIKDLYTDEQKWTDMSMRARDYLRENYSFDVAVETMRAALLEVEIDVPKDQARGLVIKSELP